MGKESLGKEAALISHHLHQTGSVGNQDTGVLLLVLLVEGAARLREIGQPSAKPSQLDLMH